MPSEPIIGSLFSGYGGLELGVMNVLGGHVAWHCDNDKAATKVLARHWPDVPNLGDITAVDWATVEPVDVVTAGYPCQPFSVAGERRGVDDDRHLWPHVANCLSALRPDVVFLENVRGHLSLGFDEVLRDLSLLKYDTHWLVLRAADVGACHGRARLFILGRNVGQLRGRSDRRRGLPGDTPREGSGHLRHPHPSGHGDQGHADSAPTPEAIRGADHGAPAGDASERSQGRVDPRRRQGVLAADGSATEPRAEGGPSCVPDGLVGVDPSEPGREGPTALGRRPSPACPAPDAAGAGGEHARTVVAVRRTWPKRGGGLPVGRVVGPAGRPLRASSVPWAAAGFRDDAGRRDLPVGAPHGRFRVFVVAWPQSSDPDRIGRRADLADVRPWEPDAGGRAAADTYGIGRERAGGSRDGWPRPEDSGRGAPADPDRDGFEGVGRVDTLGCDTDGRGGEDVAWGVYEPAVRRWESVLGRPAPSPTELGRTGPRLSARFAEWMMGLPDGWVCDVPGISRSDQLRILGNGVIPLQAETALRALSAVLEQVA